MVQAAADHQTRSHAAADGDQEKVLDAHRGSDPAFGQGGAVGVVVDDDGAADPIAEIPFDRSPDQTRQVRTALENPVGPHHAGHADADAVDGGIRRHFLERLRKRRSQLIEARVQTGGAARRSQRPAVVAGEHRLDALPADIEARPAAPHQRVSSLPHVRACGRPVPERVRAAACRAGRRAWCRPPPDRPVAACAAPSTFTGFPPP